MADTHIPSAPLRSPLVDDKTPGLATRAWSAWWQRLAEVVADLADRLLAIEGMLMDVVPGIGSAGKALVLDANADIVGGLHDLAVDGAVRWDDLLLLRDEADVLALHGDEDQPVSLRLYDSETDYSTYGFDAAVGGEVSIGAAPASSGHLRLPQMAAVTGRNAAGDGDLDVIESYESSDNLDVIKFGGTGAIWMGKTSGAIPLDLSNGFFWVEYTASSAAVKVRVGGVTQTIASVFF